MSGEPLRPPGSLLTRTNVEVGVARFVPGQASRQSSRIEWSAHAQDGQLWKHCPSLRCAGKADPRRWWLKRRFNARWSDCEVKFGSQLSRGKLPQVTVRSRSIIGMRRRRRSLPKTEGMIKDCWFQLRNSVALASGSFVRGVLSLFSLAGRLCDYFKPLLSLVRLL